MSPQEKAIAVGLLAQARRYAHEAEQAIRDDDPKKARRMVAVARQELGRVDTRLAPHAYPPV